MAACDYRLCDLCSRKVYYDASAKVSGAGTASAGLPG